METINPRQKVALAKLGIAPMPRPQPDVRWDDPGSIEEIADPEERYRQATQAVERAKTELERVRLESARRVQHLRELSRELTMCRAGAVRDLHRRGHSLSQIAQWLGIKRSLVDYLDGLATGRREVGH